MELPVQVLGQPTALVHIGTGTRVLVTGGAGFVGSQVALRLLQYGAQVTVLDDFSTGTVENLAPLIDAGLQRQDVQTSDVCEVAAVEQVVERLVPQVIIHLAAQARVLESVEDPYDDARRNILGTLAVARAAIRARSHLILTSSGGAIYGSIPDLHLPGTGAKHEDSPKTPASPYGLSKRTAADYLDLYGRLYGLRSTVLNLANVYGPRLDHRPGTGFVERALAAAEQGRPVVVYGDGTQSRDFVFIDDVVDAFVCACQYAPTGSYNVGSGKETMVAEVVGIVEDLLGRKLAVEHVAAKAGEVHRIFLDLDRAWSDLRWRPRTALLEGIRRTVASCRRKPAASQLGETG